MPAKKDSITIISESSDYEEENRELKNRILAQIKNPETPIRILRDEDEGSKDFPFAVKKLAESPPKPYAFYSV